MSKQWCLGCGKKLPDNTVMCSRSHTIKPGDLLCSACGRRETLEPAWAEGRRIGLLHAKAATSVIEGKKND